MTAFRTACSHRFSPYSMECGEALTKSASLTLLERGPTVFIGRVDDEVASIATAEGSPQMFAVCTCRLFALGLDGCRHLWALVATLDDADVVGAEMIRPGFDLVPRHPPSAKFFERARDVQGPERARRRRGRARRPGALSG